MSLQPGVDYIFAPAADLLGGAGITKACVVGTKNYLLIVPIDAIGGAGFTTTTTRWTVNASDPLPAVQKMLAEIPSVEQLEQELLGVLSDKRDEFVIELAPLQEFKVKVGWLSGGVYWRFPGKGRKAMNLRGKPAKLAFQAFYQAQMK